MDAQQPQQAPMQRTPYALLALLMAMTALGPFILNVLIPAVPQLVVTMDTDPGTVQLTVSLYLAGLAISQLALGPLSDRFGRRPVVLGGLALTALASALAIAMSSIGGLIVARTIQAFGASTGLVVGRAIVRDLYDRDRAAAMIGWVTTVMVVAPMIAPLIGGVLDTALGWEAIFVFVAAASFTVLLWAFMALPETRPVHVTGGGIRFIAGEARALSTSAPFIGYVLAAALGTATFFVFLGGAPHLVIGIMGRSSAEYGAWFMLSALGYMLGNLAAARLSPRFGVDAMIRAGLGFEIFGAALAVLLAHSFPLGGPETVFAAQFFISFGNGVFLPNAIAGAVSVRPLSAGTASGLVGFAQMGTGALCAQAMGYVLERSLNAQPLAWTMLALALAATIAFVLLLRTGPRGAGQPPGGL